MRSLKTSKTKNYYDKEQDSSDEFTSVKIRGKSITQKGKKKPQTKCLQNNLLYATNLPLWFQDEKALKDNKYFGQYGTIIGVMSSVKSPTCGNDDAPQYVQSYITYKDDRDVAIVIATINDMMCFSLSLKTTYGTSRLCNNYVNGKRCTVKGCFWLHDEKNVIKMEGPFRADFEKQRLIAYDVIKNNLSYYIDKIEKASSEGDKAKDDAIVRFPSIKETIDKLIDKKIISKFTYEKAYEQYISSKKKMSETVKKIIYIRKRTWSNTDSEPEKQRENRTHSVAQQQEPKIQKNTNVISSYFKSKLKEKSQFLMNGILQSLEENQEVTSKNNVSSSLELQKDWEPLPIFTDFYTNKLFQDPELMQTEESQSGQKSQASMNEKILDEEQLKTPDTTNQSSSEIVVVSQQQMLLLNKVKQQILKSRLVKVSMLQFAQSVPFRQHEAEFEKINNLLKIKLIDSA